MKRNEAKDVLILSLALPYNSKSQMLFDAFSLSLPKYS